MIRKAICLIVSLRLLFLLNGCSPSPNKLPYAGEPERIKKVVNGKETEVEVYPTIPAFRFMNQYNQTVTEKDFSGKIYVADFFFVTCPTICPIMKKNLITVYKTYRNSPDVRILSHTIDPDHDTPAVLRQYAQDIGVTGTMWQFVTGDREAIYDIGEKHYLVTAGRDSTAPGGYIHSGAFVLIDKEKHIRALFDGTTAEGTQKLMHAIDLLRKEYE